ncbi:hypothetical protein Tco_0680837 [Tanacetum coccineum]|uniref:Uncharacterized protein n=1 Tax=Tanacetum coccineum TaxID=301880 RepID=A0ABQ4XMX6_9ASTR
MQTLYICVAQESRLASSSLERDATVCFPIDGGDQEILKSKAEIRGRSTVGWRRRQQSGILRNYGVICEEDAKRCNSRAKTKTFKENCYLLLYAVNMDDPNITMEEYIRLEEEKTRRRGKVYNWETATYGKIWYDEDFHDPRFVETEFPAIVFDDTLTSDAAFSCEPTVSPLNDNEIDFRISFDESDDEDYTVIYDENSFSYKIISVNNLKTDFENDYDKVNMPSFPSPEPEVSYSNDLDCFEDFENEFPAIVYNDALTSKSDFLTEPTISPQHIDKFNLNNEASLSEHDEEEQNVLYFNNLFPFNVIYPDDLKSDTDNDNDEIDIKQSLGGLSIEPLPTVIKIDTQWSNELLETSQDTIN